MPAMSLLRAAGEIHVGPATAFLGVLKLPARRHRWTYLLRGILAVLLVGFLQAAEVPKQTPEGFAVPQPGTRFTFPRDHGSHPDFALEWWYLTGHLYETNGARYGFQATFFRRASPRSTAPSAATPGFGDDQLYLAHMALLDAQTGEFRHQERLNRAGWDAAASLQTLDVKNGNWSLRWTQPASGSAEPTLQLEGGIRAEAAFSLTLTPAKPLVIFGTNGVSRKAAEPTAASHYLTFTRLKVAGSLTWQGQVRAVTGEAWMDHEFSASQLGEGQVGWDWASVQLRDGRELMAYRMRRQDGTTDPFSTLAWIDREGRVQHFGPGEYSWEPRGVWKSPASGAEYPAAIRLRLKDPETGRERTLDLQPLAPAQELTGAIGGIPYWEGACRVLDEQGQEIGQAFLEMTGYAATMQGRL